MLCGVNLDVNTLLPQEQDNPNDLTSSGLRRLWYAYSNATDYSFSLIYFNNLPKADSLRKLSTITTITHIITINIFTVSSLYAMFCSCLLMACSHPNTLLLFQQYPLLIIDLILSFICSLFNTLFFLVTCIFIIFSSFTFHSIQ